MGLAHRPSRRSGAPRFEDLTETTGIPLSEEGAAMMYTRYAVAAELARGRRVLELGCGSGQGIGLLRRAARLVIGGDCSGPLLAAARAHYGSALPLVQLSADTLPFRAGAFDLVLFFEASYYVAEMTRGFQEIDRILAPGGTVMFVNANPERADFISSPHSVHYHSADEFRATLGSLGYRVRVEGAFPVDPASGGLRHRVARRGLGLARRTLEGIGLVPKTLRGRARLKRLAYGLLREVPAEIPTGFARLEPRVELPPGPAPGYKVLYVTAEQDQGTARRDWSGMTTMPERPPSAPKTESPVGDFRGGLRNVISPS
jgi:SAM-dependent methyltransferase